MYYDDNSSAGRFFMGIIAGAIIGGTLAFLYAPMSGKKLRKRISKTTEDIMDDVTDYVETSKEKANDLVKEGRRKAESILHDAKKLVSI